MTVTVGVVDHESPYPYGDILTYDYMHWLTEECRTIEDWGCGRGWVRSYVPPGRYVGVDIGVDSVPGSNPFVDVTADLTKYHSEVDGIFMRHVLEHNFDWQAILYNALASFTKRFVLVVFTPWSDTGCHETIALHGPPKYPCYDPPVPNIAFDQEMFLGHLSGFDYELEELRTGTQYGVEHVVKVSRD